MYDHDAEAQASELKETFVRRLTRVRGALTDTQFELLVSDVMRTAARFVAIEKGHRG